MEWNDGITRVAGTVLQVSVYRGALISPQKLYEQVQCMLPAFFLVWYHDVMVKTRVPGDQLQYHA